MEGRDEREEGRKRGREGEEVSPPRSFLKVGAYAFYTVSQKMGHAYYAS